MKYLYTLIYFAAFSSISQAQTGMKFGVFGGLNYAHASGDYIDDMREAIEDSKDYYDDSDYYDLDFNRGGVYGRLGIHLGVSAEYEVNNELSFVTSVSYSQKGLYSFQHIKGEYESFYGDNIDIMEKTSIKVKLNYFDIPLLIKYQLNYKVYLFGGPLFSFLITEDDTVEYEYEAEWDDEDDSDSETYDWDEAWNSNDDLEDRLSGFQLGIGYQKHNYDISFKINNNSDFGEINGDDDNNNITFQISSGIEF